jgi:hypothetical protein
MMHARFNGVPTNCEYTLRLQTRVFIDAMLVSPFRAADPEKASFFWIPVWQGATSTQVCCKPISMRVQHAGLMCDADVHK